MKKLYTLLFLFFCFSGKVFPHTVLLEIDSANQSNQSVIFQRCDTLIVVSLALSVTNFTTDTTSAGHANLSHQVFPDYHHFTSPIYDTFIFYHIDVLPNLYIANSTGLLRFSLSFKECDCHADIKLSSSDLTYTFTSNNFGPDSASQIYTWTLNGDTLGTDSTGQSSFTFDSSGMYQICLHVDDTIANCSFITCKGFTVDTSKYLALLDSVNLWHMFCIFIAKETDQGGYHDRASNCNYGGYQYLPPVYFTSGDTVLNSLAYKILYNGSSTNSASCLYGFIREDGIERKIYFKDVVGNAEQLLYDFSMQVGDSFPVHFYGQNYFFHNGTYRLDSVKSIAINSKFRKFFYLNNYTNFYGPLIWIEGIGNLGDPIYTYSSNQLNYDFTGNCVEGSNCFNSGQCCSVACFEHTEKVYFDSCSYNQSHSSNCFHGDDSCDYYCVWGDIEEIPSLSSFTISPNPASDKAVLELNVKQSNNFTIVVQSLDGKKVLEETNLGWLQEGQHNKSIPVYNLSEGIYLVGCKTNEGTVYRKLVVQR